MLKKIVLSIATLLLLFSTARSQQETANILDPRLQLQLPDVKGDTISLASLKGKVVLLDFWASWCVPCRLSNRQLVKLYKKYKDRGFEIYGVSVDEEKSDWMRAIAQDKITWIQVNDNAGNMGRTVMQWNITAIPTSFLINQAGDVVAINAEGKKLDKLVQSLLGK